MLSIFGICDRAKKKARIEQRREERNFLLEMRRELASISDQSDVLPAVHRKINERLTTIINDNLKEE